MGLAIVLDLTCHTTIVDSLFLFSIERYTTVVAELLFLFFFLVCMAFQSQSSDPTCFTHTTRNRIIFF